MNILKKIREFREDYLQNNTMPPRSIVITYNEGLQLLETFDKEPEIEKLLKENNKEKIIKFLSGGKVYGMRIIISEGFSAGDNEFYKESLKEQLLKLEQSIQREVKLRDKVNKLIKENEDLKNQFKSLDNQFKTSLLNRIADLIRENRHLNTKLSEDSFWYRFRKSIGDRF